MCILRFFKLSRSKCKSIVDDIKRSALGVMINF